MPECSAIMATETMGWNTGNIILQKIHSLSDK
jgi:hypothetical protein